MNIKVFWDNDAQTIMRYQFFKGWSWADLRNIFDEGYALLDTVDHPVDVIMDFSEASIFAPSGAINQARHVSNNQRHANLGLTAVVGSSFISSIFHMINKLAGNMSEKWDITFVNSLAEAYEAVATYATNREKS